LIKFLELYFHLGYWKFKSGDHQESVDNINKAINGSNHKNISLWYHYWRGMAHFQLGNINEALEDFLMFIY
jgi:tetratricopeptide (TPR) repeat protein